eukprot:6322968-Pyramimonas_sp.AAC.1
MEEKTEAAWKDGRLALAMRLAREVDRYRIGPKKRDGRAGFLHRHWAPPPLRLGSHPWVQPRCKKSSRTSI